MLVMMNMMVVGLSDKVKMMRLMLLLLMMTVLLRETDHCALSSDNWAVSQTHTHTHTTARARNVCMGTRLCASVYPPPLPARPFASVMTDGRRNAAVAALRGCGYPGGPPSGLWEAEDTTTPLPKGREDP